MDVLTLTAACILCTTQPSAPARTAQWQPIIAMASARFAIPEAWIARVIQAESGGQTTFNGEPITSSAGAMGLMQIMPRTYAELRAHYGLGSNPYNPRDNILAGTAYLRAMYVRYGYPFLFAVYNAGPARFDDFLLHGQPLPQATLAYVGSIIPNGISALNTVATRLEMRVPIAKNRSAADLFFAVSDTPQSQKSIAIRAINKPADGANPILAMPQNASVLFVPLSAPSH